MRTMESFFNPFITGRSALQSQMQDGTLYPPFLLQKVDEMEADSFAQRQFAYDFHQAVSAMVFDKDKTRMPVYPSVLDILELHKEHKAEINKLAETGQVTLPMYTLKHVTGVGIRMQRLEKQASPQMEIPAAFRRERIREYVENLIWCAGNVERAQYPLVIQETAIDIQQALRAESQAFLDSNAQVAFEFFHPEQKWKLLFAFNVQYFPGEHPDMGARRNIQTVIGELRDYLKQVRNGEPNNPFFPHKLLVQAAILMSGEKQPEYTQQHLIAGIKRSLLPIDVQTGWNDASRDAFGVYDAIQKALQEPME